MSKQQFSDAGMLIVPGMDFEIDIASVLESMRYKKPVYSAGGTPMNRPCHVLMADKDGDDNYAIQNDYGNGFVMGMAGEDTGGSPHLGAVIGKRRLSASGVWEIHWGIFIADRHRHMLESGHFMDWVVRLGLDVFGMMDFSQNDKRIMCAVLRQTADNMQWLYANLSEFLNPQDKHVVGSTRMVMEDGERFTQERLANGRILERDGW